MSDATHSVLAHLGVRAREYDTAIRAFVPGYEQAHAMTAAQAEAHFTAWADEDTYRPVATELALLEAAGFAEPEVFSKHGPTTVFGAFR